MSDPSWSALTIAEVQRLFAPVTSPWWIAGGHAIDLFVGRSTRPHGDIDVQILRGNEASIARCLTGWDLQSAKNGQLTPWSLEDRAHAIWCRPTAASPWALELLVADTVENRWIYRRDNRVSCPIDELGGRTRDGVPFVRPEIQLLFKSKRVRPQDEADFQVALPELSGAARDWLRAALTHVAPAHSWLLEL